MNFSLMILFFSQFLNPFSLNIQINFMLLISRQGKTRLTKWFVSMGAKVKIIYLQFYFDG